MFPLKSGQKGALVSNRYSVSADTELGDWKWYRERKSWNRMPQQQHEVKNAQEEMKRMPCSPY